MTHSKIGDAPHRREDRRFITGQGNYLDDLSFPNVAHAAVLRSPHAHADIGGAMTDAARRAPGVLAILTAADAERDGLKALRPSAEANVKKLGEGLLSNEVDSWMTGINSNVDGKQTRIIARYSGSAPAYRAWCDEVATNGYREMRFA